MGAFLSLINPVAEIIDRVIPDKTQAAQAKAALLQTEVQGQLASAVAQLQTDSAEAANKSVFVAGWRPFVGWICGIAFGYAFVVQPFLTFVLVACKINFDASKIPQLNLAVMSPVLMGMLGLGAMRSYDKTQGTDNGH